MCCLERASSWEFDEMGDKTCRAFGEMGEDKLVCYAHLGRQNEQFLPSVNAVRMMWWFWSRSPCAWSDTVLTTKRKQTFFAGFFLLKYHSSHRQFKAEHQAREA